MIILLFITIVALLWMDLYFPNTYKDHDNT